MKKVPSYYTEIPLHAIFCSDKAIAEKKKSQEDISHKNKKPLSALFTLVLTADSCRFFGGLSSSVEAGLKATPTSILSSEKERKGIEKEPF